MKNVFKLFGITALVAVIGFSMIACDTGGGGGGGGPGRQQPAGPATTTYVSYDDNGDKYELEITEAAGRAVYTPKSGDTYKLTITLADGGGTKTSTGTITVTELTLTLTPLNAETTTFTVTVTSSGEITQITGTITLTDGTTVNEPEINKSKVYPTFDLPAHHVDNAGDAWGAQIRFSEFTAYIPKKGDTVKIRISGTSDKVLNNFRLAICCDNGDWFDDGPYAIYTWEENSDQFIWEDLGTHALVDLPLNFDKTFEIRITDDPKPNTTVRLTIEKILTELSSNFDSGETLPTDYVNNETVMATITNFKIARVF
jgi:predicted RNA-binding protein with TRAM domain